MIVTVIKVICIFDSGNGFSFIQNDVSRCSCCRCCSRHYADRQRAVIPSHSLRILAELIIFRACENLRVRRATLRSSSSYGSTKTVCAFIRGSSELNTATRVCHSGTHTAQHWESLQVYPGENKNTPLLKWTLSLHYISRFGVHSVATPEKISTLLYAACKGSTKFKRSYLSWELENAKIWPRWLIVRWIFNWDESCHLRRFEKRPKLHIFTWKKLFCSTDFEIVFYTKKALLFTMI